MAAVAVLVCVACASSRTEERGSTAAPQHAATAAPATGMGEMAGMCPMEVPGTTVAAADTADGEALTFTTTSGQVDELRRRVRAMAQMHEQHHAAGDAGTGHGAMPEHAMGEGHPMPPPSHARVEDVDQGARVTVTPIDPGQADQLRNAVRTHAAQMQRDGCAMMGAHPH